MDNVSKKTRSKIMSRVHSSGNKTTERRLRAMLVCKGIRGWKVRPNYLKGNPDFVFEREKIVIFVDGSFWHGAPSFARFPKSNCRYWKNKIAGNVERDMAINKSLRSKGWCVLRFWDTELKNNIDVVIRKIECKICERANF